MTLIDWPAAELVNPEGQGPVVLICEHASSFIPPELNDLGLAEAHRYSHAVWDIGARDMAVRLAAKFDAPLVAGMLSRLVYDCNRPPEAPDSIPEKSEIVTVPGNRDLSHAARHARCTAVHDPFHAAIDHLLEARSATQAIVTLHSFTPIYNGQKRALDIGFLHDSDPRLAQYSLAHAAQSKSYKTALNQPYDATDGVTYSLRKHAIARQLPNVMIEVRNDLIASIETSAVMADFLFDVLVKALNDFQTTKGAA